MLGLILSIEEADVNKLGKRTCCLGTYILGSGSRLGDRVVHCLPFWLGKKIFNRTITHFYKRREVDEKTCSFFFETIIFLRL